RHRARPGSRRARSRPATASCPAGCRAAIVAPEAVREAGPRQGSGRMAELASCEAELNRKIRQISKPAILAHSAAFLMTSGTTPSMTYLDAGVDIDAGVALVDRIKPLAARTMRPGVMAGIGGFGALFEIPRHLREPVMGSGIDGVVIKLCLVIEW